MIFQDAPTAFDGVVLAVIRRRVREPDCQMVLRHEGDEPLHKLGAPAVIRWAIIQIDDQGRDVGEALADGLPPLGEASDEAITGHCGRDTVHKQLANGGQEMPTGVPVTSGAKSWSGGLHLPPTLPTAGEGAHCDGHFGIQGDPSDVVRRLGGAIHLDDLREDGVSFWDFFGD